MFDMLTENEYDVINDLLSVLEDLDGFQRSFEVSSNQIGKMPGDAQDSERAMQIVEAARAALAKYRDTNYRRRFIPCRKP